MLPWTPRRWGAGEEQAPEKQGPSAGSDPGQAWDSGEEALREPRTTPQDRWALPAALGRNPRGAHSVRRSQLSLAKKGPQPWSRRPSWARKEQLLPRPPPGLAAERSPGTPVQPRPPVPLSPEMTWEVAPSRMTLLAPRNPNCEAKPGPRLVWGLSCESGTSFSGRTLRHPSFCPLYEAASGRGLRPSLAGHQSGEQAPRDAGFPVMCCEDVFLSDPLLPRGQRAPLYVSQARQQVMGSLKLLLPPPVMSPRVLPTPSSGCSTAWLSGPELIALTGLLQMSQGEPRPSSPGAPMPPAGPPDPASDHPGASGGQSCSHCTDPSLPRAPDSQGP
ncbi:histone deacetylase complex subunit SAP25 isoform X1 [Balaenoptera musculus]|uniref:Histone deacetylase complex subunit SAP25 isoform X1 n=1 Tax=Balaenoptera musculus TaxID=9771 RepID=A0A8B8V7R8_BALMU|nr:histone deacetylase complex subunit SAP25 isoform X1 [Balaenoptera musculus]